MILLVLGPRLSGPTLILFTVAIIVSAYVGGPGPGLASTLTAFVLASYFLLPPLHDFAIASNAERWQQAILVFAGVLISLICGSLRRSRIRATLALQALEHAQAGQSQLAAIVESSDDAIIGKDLQGVITSWNKGAVRIFGFTAEEITGRPISQLIPLGRQSEELEIIANIRQGKRIESFETLRCHKDGSLLQVSASASPIRDQQLNIVGVSAVYRHIGAHRRHELEMARVHRLYATLSEVNQAIVWTPSREELFSKVCNSLVRTAGFHMAWVGVLDPEIGGLVCAAQCGDDTGVLANARLAIRDTPEAHGPTATAFREGRAIICNDFATDTHVGDWRMVAQSLEIRDAAAIPVRLDDKVCGVVSVYSRETDSFHEREAALLAEVGVDVSFALGNMAARERRLQSERALQEHEETLRIITENARIGLTMVDDQLRYRFANRAYGEYLGIGPQVVGRGVMELSGSAEGDELESGLREAFAGQRGVSELSRGSGEHQRHFIVNYEPIVAQAGISRAIAVVTDVTTRKLAEKKLQLLQSAVMQSRESILITDASLDRPGPRIEFVNPAFTSMTGYSAHEAIGQSPRMLQGSDTDSRVMERLRSALAKGVVFEGEAQNYKKDGSAFTNEWQVTPIRETSGVVTHFLAIQRDITERKVAEDRLRFLTRVHAMFSGIAMLMMREHDRDTLYSEACRIAVETGGFKMAVLSFKASADDEIAPRASAGQSAELLRAITLLKEDAQASVTSMTARALSSRLPVISNDAIEGCPEVLRSVYAASGVRSVAVFPLLIQDEAAGSMALFSADREFFHKEEVTLLGNLTGDIAFALDALDKAERLERAAFYDPLTGQANRRLFMDRLQQSLRSHAALASGMALLIVDLERFKNVNESLGRAAGDALLLQTSDWLVARIGASGNMARVGANQFAVALPDLAGDAEVIRWIEEALEAFQVHAFRTSSGDVSLSARVGIAMSPEDGTDAEVLFGRAEAALAKAKGAGDRYLLFSRQMTESIVGRLSLEHRLRLALVKDEFVLHYQPKFSLATGKLTGAEALLRWQPADCEQVPPAKFIHLLEETGTIIEVGNWVIQKALEDHARWRLQGLPVVRIAVNASALQLRHRTFVDGIRAAIGPDNLPCDALELEITESVIMKDVDFAIERLNALRELGICIAIDDFGTGFSSLSYLARLPLDTLKIDRAFVSEMVASQTGRALVSTIIRLAEALGLKTVAEGVETLSQRDLLATLRCQELQGFLLGRPCTAEQFESRYLVPGFVTGDGTATPGS